ncbi:hypothetical protein DERF_013699 [Dermatophagoides farinae]|uniref:Uncharacterized protein n=1 Tax=Dermatophagoides farinae TaxID=6954 RepID=A0A922HN25_DERFA|nr:hypothetical protein DERF_013699 [Dermatophagoides farinae]
MLLEFPLPDKKDAYNKFLSFQKPEKDVTRMENPKQKKEEKISHFYFLSIQNQLKLQINFKEEEKE